MYSRWSSRTISNSPVYSAHVDQAIRVLLKAQPSLSNYFAMGPTQSHAIQHRTCKLSVPFRKITASCAAKYANGIPTFTRLLPLRQVCTPCQDQIHARELHLVHGTLLGRKGTDLIRTDASLLSRLLCRHRLATRTLCRQGTVRPRLASFLIARFLQHIPHTDSLVSA
jgi:hypothetical protein